MPLIPNQIPTRPLGRDVVYAVVDGERNYQDAQRGNAKRHEGAAPNLTPGEVILCAEKCLSEARDAWYRPDGGTACLPFLRKVAALGVQALENYGAPAREGFDPGGSVLVPEKIGNVVAAACQLVDQFSDSDIDGLDMRRKLADAVKALRASET